MDKKTLAGILQVAAVAILVIGGLVGFWLLTVGEFLAATSTLVSILLCSLLVCSMGAIVESQDSLVQNQEHILSNQKRLEDKLAEMEERQNENRTL